MVARSSRSDQTAGGLRGPGADGGGRPVSRTGRTYVAPSERAEVVLNHTMTVASPLAFQETLVHTAGDGPVQISGPRHQPGRHPLYMQADRTAPKRQPPQAIDPTL